MVVVPPPPSPPQILKSRTEPAEIDWQFTSSYNPSKEAGSARDIPPPAHTDDKRGQKGAGEGSVDIPVVIQGQLHGIHRILKIDSMCACGITEIQHLKQCDDCDEWFYYECAGTTDPSAAYYCTYCDAYRSPSNSRKSMEYMIIESDEPVWSILRAASPHLLPVPPHTEYLDPVLDEEVYTQQYSSSSPISFIFPISPQPHMASPPSSPDPALSSPIDSASSPFGDIPFTTDPSSLHPSPVSPLSLLDPPSTAFSPPVSPTRSPSPSPSSQNSSPNSSPSNTLESEVDTSSWPHKFPGKVAKILPQRSELSTLKSKMRAHAWFSPLSLIPAHSSQNDNPAITLIDEENEALGEVVCNEEEHVDSPSKQQALSANVSDEDSKEHTTSVSSLAKKPWLDGWVLARAFALRYIREAKEYYTGMGTKVSQIRQLPTQLMIRAPTKGKRPWRQAEMSMAVQFLKTAGLVETSKKTGTVIKNPVHTVDYLIKVVQSVKMPKNISP